CAPGHAVQPVLAGTAVDQPLAAVGTAQHHARMEIPGQVGVDADLASLARLVEVEVPALAETGRRMPRGDVSLVAVEAQERAHHLARGAVRVRAQPLAERAHL